MSGGGYPTLLKGPALVNYANGGLDSDLDPAFARTPGTPLLRSYAGDPVQVHALVAPGSEQPHSFNLGGLSWPIDQHIPMSSKVQTMALTPWESLDSKETIAGGAGGGFVGDFFYGDLRRPYVQAGMWGLQRVLSPDDPSCPIESLNGNGGCGDGGPAPPAVRIIAAPRALTNDATPSFRFLVSDPTATLQCSLSAAAPELMACPGTDPAGAAYPAVADGRYTFMVKASNANGSATASATLTVDTTAPPASITAHPGDPTADAAVGFGYASPDPGATFECSLVPAAAADQLRPCPAAGETFGGLADGRYRFAVRAVDGAGNAGAAATFAFMVDTSLVGGPAVEAPAVRLAAAKVGAAAVPVAVTWSASDPSGIRRYVSFEAAVDGGPFVAVALPRPTATSVTRMLAPGTSTGSASPRSPATAASRARPDARSRSP